MEQMEKLDHILREGLRILIQTINILDQGALQQRQLFARRHHVNRMKKYLVVLLIVMKILRILRSRLAALAQRPSLLADYPMEIMVIIKYL